MEKLPIITSKKEVAELVRLCLDDFPKNGLDELVKNVHIHILKKKIRFPLLEQAAKELYQRLPADKHIEFLDRVVHLHEIGGNVLLGMILQLRLAGHFDESLRKATEYIIIGNEWYVCDIIGERVMGHGLLVFPEKMLPKLEKLSRHSDKWMVRSVGVATHYAVKKGLKKQQVEKAFQLLLSCADTTEFHTKKGIGWAAKTVAKFHPDIIKRYRDEWENNDRVKIWFRTKIAIGLSRKEKYATRYTS